MSPRKFLKNLSILSVFALILTTIGYGTYVYADKYVWTNLGSPTTNWQAVAMTNNSYGYAGVGSSIYRTTDGGSSWNYLTDFGGAQYPIRSIATSEDGSYVFVSYDNVMADGDFSVSNNYGASFSGTAPQTAEYYGVAMSEGGQYMYVTDQTNNRLLYSSNYGQGASWSYTDLSYTPVSVAVSNDGMYVYTATNFYILKSTDYGVNNNTVYNSGTYVDIAASANGQYVYAIPSSGYPVYSSDYGTNFIELSAAGSRAWKSVSVSGDGSKVVLVSNDGSSSQVFSSRDYGSTFTTESSVGASLWNDISLSSDGYIALLASSDSYLYTGNLDVIAPSISSIVSNTANGTYKLGSTIQLRVNSNEPIYNSSLFGLTLETGATDRGCAGSFATGDTYMTCTYTVQAGDTTSDLGTNAISGTLIDDQGNPRIDHSGALNSLASNQSIVIDGIVPTVTLTAPTNGSTASSTVSLTATASDVGTGLVGVQFRVGTTSIGVEDTSSPYTASWNSTAVSDGSYTLHAVARDVAGNYATSSVTITVDNTAPNAPTSLDLVTLSDTGASTTDNFTSDVTPDITLSCENSATVNLYRAGSTLIGSGACSSGTVTITSSTLAEGSHTITARQTDLAGNTSSASSDLSITIDTTGPSVSITSPTTGATVNGSISIDATATDSLTSVAGVLFSHGTTTIGSEDTSSPYSVSLDTTTLTDGSYTLNALARDVVGNYSTSTISITITNAVTTSSSSESTQSSGPTAYSTPPSAPIPGIYNPAKNNSGNEIVSPTKALASAIVQSAGIPSNFKFTKNATVRTINNEVINLQRMLNTMGYTVSTTGVGSKGKESFFFGPKTRLALIRFQRAFAVPATGFFGPLTRAAMNRVLNSIQ